MNKAKIAMMFGVMVGLSFSGVESAHAQGLPFAGTVLKVNDPSQNDLARVNNGRLRKTDEEFTNEQGVVNVFAGSKRGLYVEMRTSALADGTMPVNRMQAACTPVELTQAEDGKVQVTKLPGETFVTDNRGNEYRNANKPELVPINGGKNMLLMFNYQAAGTNDTKRYVKVLNENCQPVTLKNARGQVQKQVVVMAKNNDDCDMHQSGEGPCDVATDANGVTHLTCWAGCNGNGADDGWINDVTVSCQNGADGSASECTVRKNFDVSLAQREERSRGRCTVADADPNTAICTWTEGNTQPQRDGTWIAAVDISPNGEQGANAQSRVLWKKLMSGRVTLPGGARAYSVRAKSTRILAENPDGTLTRTEDLLVQVGLLRGNNNNNRKGGRYVDQRMGVVRATRAGIEWVVPLTSVQDMLLGIDGTHLTMSGGLVQVGDKVLPSVQFLQGSQNGGGAASPDLKVIAVDLAAKKFVDLGTYGVGGSYDRHLYANYLGNNPGNQGRNFAGATLVKNPFVGQNGNTSKYLLLHALTGKDPENIAKPELKPSSYVALTHMVAQGPAPAPQMANNGSGGGQNADQVPADPAAPDPEPAGNVGTGGNGVATTETPAAGSQTATETPAQPASFAGGCSVASTSTSSGFGLFFLVAGLAFVGLVRRRRA